MLDTQTVVADAFNASRSMEGLCIEMIDALTSLSGCDMRELSHACPVEFSDLHRSLSSVRNKIAAVRGLAAESAAL